MSTPRYTPTQKVVWGRTASGKKAIMGRRTAAHLDATINRLRKLDPKAELVVTQSAYNTSVEASAGTHNLDAVIDIVIHGMSGIDTQAFMRRCGWADWYRHPPEFAFEHNHGISLGYEPAPVGEFVPGQVRDYYNHALGLKGQHEPGSDKTWFPPDIDKTVFNYRRFILFHPRWNRRHPTIP